jgi:hypothetical protein
MKKMLSIPLHRAHEEGTKKHRYQRRDFVECFRFCSRRISHRAGAADAGDIFVVFGGNLDHYRLKADDLGVLNHAYRDNLCCYRQVEFRRHVITHRRHVAFVGTAA